MPDLRGKALSSVEYLDESNAQLRAITGYMYLNRLRKHIRLSDEDTFWLIDELKQACRIEIGADLALLWSCTDFLLNEW